MKTAIILCASVFLIVPLAFAQHEAGCPAGQISVLVYIPLGIPLSGYACIPQIAGPPGPPGAPGKNGIGGLNGQDGKNGAAGVPGATGPAVITQAAASPPVSLEGWTVVGDATTAPMQDGSVLIKCPGSATNGLCGIWHPIGDYSTVEIQPACGSWCDIVFGLWDSGAQTFTGVSDVFAPKTGWTDGFSTASWSAATGLVTGTGGASTLQSPEHAWFRIAQGVFEYASEGIVYYAKGQAPATAQGDSIFIGFAGGMNIPSALILRSLVR